MDKEKSRILSNLINAKPANESEVETKVLLHLFRMLGYTDSDRADKPSVRMNFGRERTIKHPDFILYDGEERTLESALLAVEAKAKGESLDDAEDQVKSYAVWAGAPFYMVSDGDEIRIAQFLPGDSTAILYNFKISDLPESWDVFEGLVGKTEAILAKERIGYINTYLPKIEELPVNEFFREYFMRLKERYENIKYTEVALDPRQINGFTQPKIPVNVILENKVMDEHSLALKLNNERSNVYIVGEPGIGKTTLCKRLIYYLALQAQERGSDILPIFLHMRRGIPSSIYDAFSEECKEMGLRLFPKLYELSITKSYVILILDGLDEYEDRYKFKDRLYRIINSVPNISVILVSRPGIEEAIREIIDRYNIFMAEIKLLDDVQLRDIFNKYLISDNDVKKIFDTRKRKILPNIYSPMMALMIIRVAKNIPKWESMNIGELYTEYLRVLHNYFNSPLVRGSGTQIAFNTILSVLAKTACIIGNMRTHNEVYTLNDIYEKLSEYFDEREIVAFMNMGIISSFGGRAEFLHLTFEEYGIAWAFIKSAEIMDVAGFLENRPTEMIYSLANSLMNEEAESNLVAFLGDDNNKLRRRAVGILKHGCTEAAINTIWRKIRDERSIKIWSRMNYILLRSGHAEYREWLVDHSRRISRRQVKLIALAAKREGGIELLPYIISLAGRRRTPELISATFEMVLKFQEYSEMDLLIEYFNKQRTKRRLLISQTLGRYRNEEIARLFIQRQIKLERSLRVISMFLNMYPEVVLLFNRDELCEICAKINQFKRLKIEYQKKVLKACNKMLDLVMDETIMDKLLSAKIEIVNSIEE